VNPNAIKDRTPMMQRRFLDNEIKRMIVKVEQAMRSIYEFRSRQAEGSDLQLVAGDALKALYVMIDVVAGGTPQAQAGLT
jgi:hypothetical protein